MPDTTDHSSGRIAWITRGALLLMLGLVVCRTTIMEFPRDPFPVTPGSEAIPRGAGASTGAVLDWLCFVPGLLVLARRLVDRHYTLKGFASLIPLAALAIWSVCSIGWADDRFIAALGVSHWWAAIALLFAASQLIRDWASLRIVSAVVFGILLISVTQALVYQYQDLPVMQESWAKSRQEVLAQRGWEEDSFAARQFENRIRSGDMSGFSASPNTFAAVLVLTMMLALGIIAQRLAERPIDPAIVVPILGFLSAWWIIFFTRSKAGYITPLLGIAIMGTLAIPVVGRLIAARRRTIFVLGVIAVALGFAAVVGHGMYHGSLPTDSMNFRWRYWVGSWRLFEAHPLAGVGWNNFGDSYLRFRLPVAAEEIKDPHNLFVRFATELGIIGLILLVAWLIRAAWEITGAASRRDLPTISTPKLATTPRLHGSPVKMLGSIGLLGITLNIVASIDFDQQPAYWSSELLRRFLFLCVFMLGGVIVLARSLREETIDARPAPWLLSGLVIAAGLFWLHNLIDFSMFDTSPGPLMVLMLILGAAMGMRNRVADARSSSLTPWVIACPLAIISWIIAGGLFVAPLLASEALAEQGDNAVRAGQFATATRRFIEAADRSPVSNSDYLLRAASSSIRAGQSPREVLSIFDRMLAARPGAGGNQVVRARYLMSLPDFLSYRDQIVADYTAATEGNPNEARLHIEFADVARRLDLPQLATEQYRLALHYNDLLPDEEPKRLSTDEVRHIQTQLRELQATIDTPRTSD